MKQLTSKIFKDTFIVMIANIINYAGMFIIAVMISRLLDVGALGKFTYIVAVSSVAAIISELGLSQLLIRRINEDRPGVFTLIKNVNIFKLQLSAVTAAVFLVIIYILQNDSFTGGLVLGISAIIPKAIYSTYDSSLRALRKQTQPSAVKSINALIQAAAAYFILLKTGNLINVFLMMFVMEILTAIVFKYISSSIWKNTEISFRPSEPYSYSALKPVIKEVLPFFGSGLLAFSIPRVIMIILENLAGAVSLGIFSAASRFANGIGLLSGALYNTFYPAMTDPGIPPESRKKIALKFSSYAFIVGIVISAAIFFSADLLISLTFKIPEAVPVLKIMGFTVIPILTYSVLQPYLISIGKEKFIFKLYLFLWLVNIPLSLFIIHHHSIAGAAFNSLIIEYLLFINLYLKLLRNR